MGTLLFGSVFTVSLIYACVTDVRDRRIPNVVVALLLGVGLVYSLAAQPSLGALLRALGSVAIGFAIWIPFYALRMLGAGDVKLFAAASAWLAPIGVLRAAAYSALIGGALALFWFFRSQGVALAVTRLVHASKKPGILREPLPATSKYQKVPYGVAMAAGLLFTAWRSRFWV